MRIAAIAFAAAALTSSAFAASPYVDCTKARTSDEKAVCRSVVLVQMDAEMSTLYRVLKGLVAMGQRGALQDEQADWLKARRECGAAYRCLRDHYQDRIEELDAVLDRIRAQGPF